MKLRSWRPLERPPKSRNPPEPPVHSTQGVLEVLQASCVLAACCCSASICCFGGRLADLAHLVEGRLGGGDAAAGVLHPVEQLLGEVLVPFLGDLGGRGRRVPHTAKSVSSGQV